MSIYHYLPASLPPRQVPDEESAAKMTDEELEEVEEALSNDFEIGFAIKDQVRVGVGVGGNACTLGAGGGFCPGKGQKAHVRTVTIHAAVGTRFWGEISGAGATGQKRPGGRGGGIAVQQTGGGCAKCVSVERRAQHMWA